MEIGDKLAIIEKTEIKLDIKFGEIIGFTKNLSIENCSGNFEQFLINKSCNLPIISLLYGDGEIVDYGESHWLDDNIDKAVDLLIASKSNDVIKEIFINGIKIKPI